MGATAWASGEGGRQGVRGGGVIRGREGDRGEPAAFSGEKGIEGGDRVCGREGDRGR